MRSADSGNELPAELTPFLGRKTALLQTRKRDGTWVPTPVNLGFDGDQAFFRTWNKTGKYRRLKNFDEVRVAPSTLRGKPKGETIAGRARLLDGAEAQQAADALSRRFPILHGHLVPWLHRRKGWKTMHYRLTVES